ncbi:Adaptin ear-binding coat-associated protein 2 (NECAP-2) isoform 2 family protein [Toxoplasma gondii ME49]|uniref:Adaptin ear-binding coat-associated protein 2 (NECAP-2) isoform 2 family protein n=1 Tax=Toxoplasma gondii (strain ATCC 50611 / Me49) TaxID=508771 RepID=S8F1W1_TOXGM|nr:Adaptin ear-binding coat-associated protein 2 (NECAP-2) isoform 2 family protein [Toxoplasma gondii ME49]EPT29731.1 Adaptin ear-binding coat-associated protein 2 (NECAP-2) isoform 2 family protein [Toxoplasma gondii ME49]|eukprot:XP_002365433.2 Adaptin ear-binding coat-associated protein 2 (NECAP-2) isoform 2 family protein [Toxoplasma gondii ME49]
MRSCRFSWSSQFRSVLRTSEEIIPSQEMPQMATDAPEAKSRPVEAEDAAPPVENKDDNEALEFIVYNCREVTVYKIPPRTPQGHRAENWKDVLWAGKLQVASKGRKSSIRLIDKQSGHLFAVCPLPENHEEAVERAVDSSRYFVFRLDNGKGRHAYVGVSFADRNDAFDFTCALNEEERRQRAARMDGPTDAEAPSASSSSAPERDFRLMEGEKIRVNIPGIRCKSRARPSQSDSETPSAADKPSTLFSGLLPPPPESRSRDAEGQETTGNRQQGPTIPSDSFSFEFTDFQRGE